METQGCVCVYGQREPEGLGACWPGSPYIYYGGENSLCTSGPVSLNNPTFPLFEETPHPLKRTQQCDRAGCLPVLSLWPERNKFDLSGLDLMSWVNIDNNSPAVTQLIISGLQYIHHWT